MAQEFYDEHLINFTNSNGYPTICVDEKKVLLHRYVWEKFNGEIPKGFQIHHKDKNKLNWSVENLECMKTSDHLRNHAIENNLGKSNKGKLKRHSSGFCDGAKMVELIKDGEQKTFESVTEAAKFLKVKQVSAVSRVLTGKRKTIHGWKVYYVTDRKAF